MEKMHGKIRKAVAMVPEIASAYKVTLRSQNKKSRKVPTRLQILKEARGHFPEAVFPKVQFGKFSCPKKVPRSCLGHLRDLIIERRLWPLGHICGPWATNGNREGRYVQKRQYDD